MPNETFGSIWDALEDDPADAALMRLRSQLLLRLRRRISSTGWAQDDAATHLKVSPAWIADVLDGNIDALTLDALVIMVFRAGLRADLTISPASDS